MRYLMIIPVLALPCAALMMHSTACDMHLWAVDRMSNREEQAKFKGWLYRYCKIAAIPSQRWLP